MPPTFEIPVFSAAAAKVAVDHGATRLEVNRAGSYAQGGLTPTHAEIEAVASALGAHASSTVPLRVMIRPRGQPSLHKEPDFVYTDEEFQQIRSDLAALVASGLLKASRGDGFVFGVLAQTPEGAAGDGDGGGRPLRIDTDRNRQLVQAAEPYACVFHRAFDLVLGDSKGGEGDEETETENALAALRDCGFAGVLTAGGATGGAVDHIDTLRRLVAAERAVAGAAQARPHPSIEIIVGGGVRSQNLGALAKGILSVETATTTTTATADAAHPSRPHPSAVSFHSSCLADAAAATAQVAEGEVVSEAEVDRIHAALASLGDMV